MSPELEKRFVKLDFENRMLRNQLAAVENDVRKYQAIALTSWVFFVAFLVTLNVG